MYSQSAGFCVCCRGKGGGGGDIKTMVFFHRYDWFKKEVCTPVRSILGPTSQSHMFSKCNMYTGLTHSTHFMFVIFFFHFFWGGTSLNVSLSCGELNRRTRVNQDKINSWQDVCIELCV